MAIVFKSPEDWAKQYRIYLKGLKPDVNTDQTDSDWWIRSKVVGGVLSGISQDQRKIADDAFPQSARTEALERHLDLYFGSGFLEAQQSEGTVGVTGTVGTVINSGLEFTYSPNGNTYQASSGLTLSTVISGITASGIVPVISVNSGQNQNLLEGAQLVIASPPVGLSSLAKVINGDLADGKNAETNAEAAARILNRIQKPPAGGTANDYQTWATEADASVVDSNIIRWIYGPGTVGVVITAGTTDIDEAIDNGDPVVRIPSNALVEQVQDYIDAKKPLTDCAYVQKPTVVTLDVTVRVRFFDGGLLSIPAGQTLTQEQMVIREVKRAIYKTPPGGRQLGGSGFMVASEIEEVIDSNLSAAPYTEGEIVQILTDRQVDDLSASGANLLILPDQIVEPGSINVVLI